MAKYEIGGYKFESTTREEMEDTIRQAFADQWARLAGRDTVRFQSPAATAVSSAITLPLAGQAAGYVLGPAEGFVWSVRLLVVEGLFSSSTTPDVVNFYRHGSGRLVWQLNGNNFAQDFGRGVQILQPGETLYLQNSGSITASGNILFHGQADQVPFTRKGDLL